MNLLDLTLPTPEENLACDEALLDWCETESESDVLRFWEPRESFVVLGYANKVQVEIDAEACRRRGLPILRRCTGGGAVLQGPGCLNYSLLLNFERQPALQTITGTNCFIMQRHQAALAALLGAPVTVRGHTDLALGELKFSGNAQRRKRRFLLFHGTFLLGLDAGLMEEVLRSPSRQPDYRRNRSHARFVTQINATPEAIKAALRNAWDAIEAPPAFPLSLLPPLVEGKYSREEWNLKW